jgi:putative ABC transport system ATP-binding protein
VTAARKTVVDVRNVTKVFGSGHAQVEALRGIDLTVAANEFMAIMGSSGSGKSTVLHLIAGLDVPTSGTIRVGDDDLGSLNDDQLTLLRRRRMGFIFQAFNLLDALTAEENVALPLLIDGVPETAAHQRAVSCLDRVGLGARRSHLPKQLSGGEQQRVAIARALVTSPQLLLADEPTGNLDTANGSQVMALLRNLVDQHGQTILIVTHNPNHAEMTDRIVHLRDGCIVAEPSPAPLEARS